MGWNTHLKAISYFAAVMNNQNKGFIMVPTPILVWGGGGGELYTQLGFFLFSQFRPIDIFIVESCEWYH